VRLHLAGRRRLIAAAPTVAALIAGCTGDGDARSVRVPSGDSTVVGLAHVNGAVLDSVPQTARISTSAGSAPARATEMNGGEAASAAGAAHADTASDPNGRATLSAAVAPTPDELSALAASLVVPVAGVTPAELRGSFHAPRGGGTRQHNALDIPAPRGTPVISATPGRVLRLFNSKAGGLMIYAADATERFILMYGHLDRYAEGLKDGMRLERGQTIGYVGTTGNAPPTVPHLHFAIARTNNVSRWWNGTAIDPAPLFKR
jgi:murein DD-endopeptidase MepM/ murein hydrolase activator NlpD